MLTMGVTVLGHHGQKPRSTPLEDCGQMKGGHRAKGPGRIETGASAMIQNLSVESKMTSVSYRSFVQIRGLGQRFRDRGLCRQPKVR